MPSPSMALRVALDGVRELRADVVQRVETARANDEPGGHGVIVAHVLAAGGYASVLHVIDNGQWERWDMNGWAGWGVILGLALAACGDDSDSGTADCPACSEAAPWDPGECATFDCVGGTQSPICQPAGVPHTFIPTTAVQIRPGRALIC